MPITLRSDITLSLALLEDAEDEFVQVELSSFGLKDDLFSGQVLQAVGFRPTLPSSSHSEAVELLDLSF
jgi:hypothetical protein